MAEGMKATHAGSVPVPDPTVLTTSALQREIFGLRELLEGKLAALENEQKLVRLVIETRLDGMDKAIQLLQDIADKFPSRIDEKIGSLKSFHDMRFDAIIQTFSEKFASIQTQFQERDVRSEQNGKDSKVAIDAALQAAKELVGKQNESSALAIDKSERATTKQIDQLGELISVTARASDEKISDVKDRITRIESEGRGASHLWGYIVGALGAAAIVVALIERFTK